VKWTKATGASWLPDSSGFFYSRFDEPAAGAKMTRQIILRNFISTVSARRSPRIN